MKINTMPNRTPSFTGTVKYSNDLEKCIKHAKNSDLKKFEKCLKKIQTVNDGWEYSVDFKVDIEDKDTLKRTGKLVLASNSLGVMNFRTIGEESVNFLDKFKDKSYKKALKKIVSIIEDDYKKAESFNNKENIKARIYDLLGVRVSKENLANK